MNKILSFIVCVVLAVGCHSLQAQITHTSNGDIDQNAAKVLKQAVGKLNAAPVSFNVTLISKNSKKKEVSRQKAQVLFNKGKYRVQADDHTFYCNGSNVWHWDKSTNECVLNKMTEDDDDLMNPAALLSHYSTNYKAKYIRIENDGTAVIDLTPKKGRSFYKIRVLIDTNNGLLKSMTMHNYDSSCAEYQVSEFKSGVTATDADFVFPAAKNPKVEVIDMR